MERKEASIKGCRPGSFEETRHILLSPSAPWVGGGVAVLASCVISLRYTELAKEVLEDSPVLVPKFGGSLLATGTGQGGQSLSVVPQG